MKSHSKFKLLLGVLFFASLLVAALGSWSNVQASGAALQEPPPVITIEPPEDDPEVLPDTGDRDNFFLPGGLLLWIVIGIAVVVALFTLFARPWYSGPPTHTHEPPHDHPEDHYH